MEQLLFVNIIFLWLVLLFNLFLTFLLVRKTNSTPRFENGIKDGSLAPPFSAKTLSDKEISLNDLTGGNFILLFTSPTCQPCRQIMPFVEELRPTIEHSGIRLFLVSIGEPQETKSYVLEANINTEVLLAPRQGNTFMQTYKVSGTPFYYLISSEGKILSSGHPGMTAENLQRATELV